MQSAILAASICREGDFEVSLCLEPDIASQGGTLDEAGVNLLEAITLFYETADEEEVRRRISQGVAVLQEEDE